MNRYKRLGAEAFGTFWLVLGGCGAAVIGTQVVSHGSNVGLGIGLLGVALAFGLTLLTMAFAIGSISGCHINPAVTIGLWVGKRFPGKDVFPYIAAQVVGAIGGAAALDLIATGKSGFSTKAGFAANGYGAHSPQGYNLLSAFVTEVVMTMAFLFVIMAVTHKRETKSLAPIPIGLMLVLIHLISIPVTNTSVNPARSTGPAVFVGGWALSQLWLFWVAPILGASIAALVYRLSLDVDDVARRPEMAA